MQAVYKVVEISTKYVLLDNLVILINDWPFMLTYEILLACW